MTDNVDANHPSGRSRLRLLARVALFAILCLIAAEGALQLGSLFVRARPVDWPESASTRILAVGDSHTYGAGLPDDQSYPAHLQLLLEEMAPGEFSVINLGLPGMSTTQVRNRLASNISHYQPDIVIVWCGVNNVWNYSEVIDEGWRPRLAGLAYNSRLYRLILVWLHNRKIDHDSEQMRAAGRHQSWQRKVTLGEEQVFQFPEGDDKIQSYTGKPTLDKWELRRGDEVETIWQTHGPRRENAATAARIHEDLKAIVAWLETAGIPVVLIRYPQNFAYFTLANFAIHQAAADSAVPLIDTSISLRRIPSEKRVWLPGHHPDGALYREIALDIVPVVDELSGRRDCESEEAEQARRSRRSGRLSE